MPDGTLKHVNPFTGTEIWTVPSRAHRPFPHTARRDPRPLKVRRVEDHCDFCRAHYFRTPPEKARVVALPHGGSFVQEHLSPSLVEASPALFRRFANLFEIVTLDYWEKNHGFRLPPPLLAWKRDYLSVPSGRRHVERLLAVKLRLAGRHPRRAAASLRRSLTDAFFGGSHDLVVSGRHYAAGARREDDLHSSGTMTPSEHAVFLRFTVQAMTDIYARNPHVRFVTVFQNWLKPAGASFDHLHKQLVGLDEWGVSIERETEMVRRKLNAYNDLIANPARRWGLVVAENEGAVALSEFGHRYPTLGVYSKSRAVRPDEHPEADFRAFSDLLHACHAAMGPRIPCNEEWYFSPRDARAPMPWHVLVKWRTLNQAGFEGNTKIYINPVSPWDLKGDMTGYLLEARRRGRLAPGVRVGRECRPGTDALRYGR
jgi:galactose-1-phosphate uridylyltransferase